MKTLTEKQIKELLCEEWVKEGTNFFILKDCTNTKWGEDLTGFNFSDVLEIMPENDKAALLFDISYICFDKNDYGLSLGVKVNNEKRLDKLFAKFTHDVLGFFKEKEKDTDWRNLLSNVLENALKETDVDSIVEFIDNNFADVSNKIRENFSENLEVDDIGEVLKDDIAKDWIDRNSDDAYDRAVDNMDSYEMKDKIIDYLQNNL